MDLAGPPVEARGRTDAVGLSLECGTVRHLGVLELLDAGEMPVDEDVVGQRPEVFGGLEFGRIRRQEQQMDVLGHAQPDAGMPPCAVEYEDDLLLGAGTHRASKRVEFDLEEWDTHRRGQVEDGAPRTGMDKPHEIAPREAVTDDGSRPLSPQRPDAAQHWLEANAVLVGGPELDLRLGMGRRYGADERADLFLNAACCAASARAWRARGVCRLCLRRCR